MPGEVNVNQEEVIQKLEVLKSLRHRYDELVSNFSSNWRNVFDPKVKEDLDGLRREIKSKVEEIEDYLPDGYDVRLRSRIARQVGAKLVNSFVDGVAVAEDWDKKKFVVTGGGRELLEGRRYTFISEAKDGFFYVLNNSGTGSIYELYSVDGRQLFGGRSFENVSEVSEGCAVIRDVAGYFYVNLVDETEMFNGRRFGRAYGFRDGFAMVAGGGGDDALYWIDKRGKEYIKGTNIRLAEAVYYSPLHPAKDTNGSYFVDKEGNDLLKGRRYKKVWKFVEGRAMVEDGMGQTYLDEDGNELIDGRFLDAKSFREGCAAVKDNKGCFFIGLDGHSLWGEKRVDYLEPMVDGVALAKVGNDWIGVDKNGLEIFPGCRFEAIGATKHSLIKVQDKKGWYVLDKTGKEVFKGKRFSSISFSTEPAGVIEADGIYYSLKGKYAFGRK